MGAFDLTDRLFIALITFDRGSDDLGILAANVQGASGWVGVRTSQENEVLTLIDQDLNDIGLRLIEIDRVVEVHSFQDVATYDDHLSENMQSWEDGRMTAWGTLHTYLADGEA